MKRPRTRTRPRVLVIAAAVGVAALAAGVVLGPEAPRPSTERTCTGWSSRAESRCTMARPRNTEMPRSARNAAALTPSPSTT